MKRILELVMIEHTLFALPMALTGTILAARGWPGLGVLLWVALAFTGARTAAMGFNRLVDAKIDAANARTAGRHIPAGSVGKWQAAGLIGAAMALYFLSAAMLNPLCLKLSPWVLIILLVYSYTKRFTAWCHVVLGLSLGMSPLAGWLAVSGQWAVTPILLGLGVIFWVAGFDTIYACQDVEFDRTTGLHSIPAKLGEQRALRLAAYSHVIAWLLWLVAGMLSGLGWPFYLLLAAVGGLLVWEHRLVNPEDLSKIDLAFFKVNSYVSGCLLAAVIAGLIAA